jgi:hypothetical protein
LICEYLHAARPGGVEAIGRRDSQTPILGTERFHVAHDPDDLGFFGDANHLVNRRDQPDVVVRLVADMARVYAVPLA